MKREIVTAQDISQAITRGLSELTVAENAIITAQAREQAARQGLKLCAPNSVAPGAKPAQISAKPDAPAKPGAPAPLPSLPFLRPGGEAAAPQSTLPEKAPQAADVYALVRKTVSEALERSQVSAPTAPQGGCSACGACSGKPEAHPAQAPGGGVLKYSTAGRVKAVDAQKLPWEKFSGKTDGQVNIVDVITPGDGSPMGGGYLEWNDVSFAWRLPYAEIDVVLEGELHISSGGKTVVGKPGDMLFIPKDTDVVFSAPGYVRFAYVTWPADWSSLVEPQNGGS